MVSSVWKWLRIDYKVALPTFKVLSTSMSSYLHRLLQERQGVHNLLYGLPVQRVQQLAGTGSFSRLQNDPRHVVLQLT